MLLFYLYKFNLLTSINMFNKMIRYDFFSTKINDVIINLACR